MFGSQSRRRRERDLLVTELSGRILPVHEAGDASGLLGAAVPGLLQDLSKIIVGGPQSEDAVDIEAVSTLVAAHWFRYLTLPEGSDRDDLQACLAWSRILLPVAAHLLPEPVRAQLSATGIRAGAVSDAAEEAAARAASLLEDFERTGNLECLDGAVSLFREAVAIAPAGHSDRPGYLSGLGAVLGTRFDLTRQLDDLDEAIVRFREVLATTANDHPERASHLSNLGAALRARLAHTGQQGDLDEAIILIHDAMAATPEDHPHRPAMLSNLAIALQTRFERTDQLEDLDEAITLIRAAVTTTPEDHPHRPRHLHNLRTAVQTRLGRTGQLNDLDETITFIRDDVSRTPTDHADRPAMLSSLANALQTRFERTGRLSDLTEAIALGREAITATDHPHRRPARLSNLGVALKSRFTRTGQLSDLNEAITLIRDAVALTPADHPDRPAMLSNLGTALQIRFTRTGQPNDLEEAIILERQVVAATPAEHPDRPARLSTLGTALQTRFDDTGQLSDLSEAIMLGRDAIASTPTNDHSLPASLFSLGAALETRFQRTGQLSDLNEAITLARDAIAGTPTGDPHRPVLLSSLALTLQTRFARTGQLSDLNAAIAIARVAVATTPADHSYRPMYLVNLASALWSQFERTAKIGDLDEALTLFEDAVAATPTEHAARSERLSHLGRARQTRFERTGHRDDLEAAIGLYRTSAQLLTSSPKDRLFAARQWGRCAVLAREWRMALQAYTLAIELLPLVVWHGLDQATREHHLREAAGLATEASAAAIAAGDPVRAVELLEAGRSMLWTQTLHLRHDLSALQATDPSLAARLERARTTLNRSSDAPIRALDGLNTAGLDQERAEEQEMLQERRLAARDWDATVAGVRRLEGFEHFLRPVPFTQLRPAADGGPVVIVNLSQHGSHALIVALDPGPAVRVVALPAAALDTALEQVNSLLGVLHRAGDPTTPEPAWENDRHTVFGILAWTWSAIAEPVLSALEHTTTPAAKSEDWPRVWWCPTGPASLLPLHAAGEHPRSQDQAATMGEAAAIANTVAGRVISSYTPTLSALTRARARPGSAPVRQLAVGVPDAPDQDHLETVSAELDILTSYLPAPAHATHLLGPQSTAEAVLTALPGHSWLHLSCHGSQHPTDASQSAFLLHDRPLTLADLAALNLPDAELAYLAACQTATGDLRLLDEALHLAAALQLIGFTHVLATQWNIVDDAAPTMAEAIYAQLTHPAPERCGHTYRPDADRAALALHHAVSRLRRHHPDEPLVWAPYTHIGP